MFGVQLVFGVRCSVGSVFGVMSGNQSECWLLCQVGSVVGPVGDQAGGRRDDGDSGGGMVTEATLVRCYDGGQCRAGPLVGGIAGPRLDRWRRVGTGRHWGRRAMLDGVHWGPLRVYGRDIRGGVVGPRSGGPVVGEIAGPRLDRQWCAGTGRHWGRRATLDGVHWGPLHVQGRDIRERAWPPAEGSTPVITR